MNLAFRHPHPAIARETLMVGYNHRRNSSQSPWNKISLPASFSYRFWCRHASRLATSMQKSSSRCQGRSTKCRKYFAHVNGCVRCGIHNKINKTSLCQISWLCSAHTDPYGENCVITSVVVKTLFLKSKKLGLEGQFQTKWRKRRSIIDQTDKSINDVS